MNKLEQSWYSKSLWFWLFLPFTLPLTLLFVLIYKVRLCVFKFAFKPRSKPVIIVGNLTVGGTGKTPFVIYLTQLLKKAGYTPAIVSRGYGADGSIGPSFPRHVNELNKNGFNPAICGDEPSLLAMRTNCPVVIDPNRTAAVEFASALSGVDIIISDDGLQHYKMARALEIVLIDGERMFGNGLMLPMGPLREPLSRLDTVDFTVVNSGFVDNRLSKTSQGPLNNAIDYQLTTDGLVQLTTKLSHPVDTEKRNVHLVSGIGNPNRFKTTALMSGLNVISEKWFEDHHDFVESDFSDITNLQNKNSNDESTDIIVMTEKDAVKCQQFAKDNWYSLPINAVISESLESALLNKIEQIKE